MEWIVADGIEAVWVTAWIAVRGWNLDAQQCWEPALFGCGPYTSLGCAPKLGSLYYSDCLIDRRDFLAIKRRYSVAAEFEMVI